MTQRGASATGMFLPLKEAFPRLESAPRRPDKVEPKRLEWQ